MLYLVAGVYELLGRNMLAVQLINASVGATTAIVVYSTADRLFNNQRVSRLAGFLVCFFPSLVLWSSQALPERRAHCSGVGACDLLHTSIAGKD